MGIRVALLLLLFANGRIAQADSSNACAGCHREIWESWKKTGMGRSFSLPSAENTPRLSEPWYHEPSDSFFSMSFRDGAWFQRRHQLDAGTGREINVMEKRVDYVLGSGNHARTYLHRTPANTLIELPLGWYSEKGGYWAMNPGYDRPDHEGFRRQVTYDCMFCHNAYPVVPVRNTKAGEAAVYGNLPGGIDCARCHGAGGAKHMELAGRPGTSRELVRQAIVNPRRLSADRQMDICMSCHLETTSFPLPGAILRHDRGPFSFVPGEPLENFILNFDHAREAGRSDKFEIVSAAYRLRQSACFLKSKGKMLCTTCHNVHTAPRSADATKHHENTCRQCHNSPLSRASHTAESGQPVTGCVQCHMPKRRTEDVIHVAMTDHLISRPNVSRDLLAERKERIDRYRGEVVPYYPAVLAGSAESDLYRAVAQVKQRSNLDAGIAQLTAAITRYAPQHAGWYLELAEALENQGQLAKALPWYREAVRRDPSSAVGWQKLGSALRRSSQPAEAVTALRRSAALSPGRAFPWQELGLTYRSLGRMADSLSAFDQAIARDADLPEAHNNIGILRFQAGESSRAEASFREAIRIQPSYADAHGNLANLLLETDRLAEAQAEFDRSLRLRPDDAGTHYNYAMLLGKTGRYEDARRELEACLQADATFVDAHELLGDLLMGLNQQTAAAGHYREAARLQPGSMRAAFGLGLSLAATGNTAEAIPHLRRAAAGSDEGIRQRATELLRQLGK